MSLTSREPDSTQPAGLITVLCVDDSPKLVQALCTLIGRETDMTVVGGVHDAAEFVRAVPAMKPRVAIVDLTMPGRTDPLDAIRTVADTVPEVRVLVYSGYDDQATKDKVMEAGAWGLVSKLAEPAAVIQAVRRVAAGEVVF